MKRGDVMSRSTLIPVFVLLLFPFTLPAQQPDGKTPLPPNNAQMLGRRLFQQHCAVCHTQPTLTSPMYGPALYNDIVNGKEDAMRSFIGKGSSRMPGFRYSLEASEINAIIAYLKTAPKPAQRSPQNRGGGPVD